MRLIVLVGARPNFIKVGPLVPALDRAGHDVGVAHTGRRLEIAGAAGYYADMEIVEPRWYLGVGWGTDAVQTGTAMIALEELLARQQPEGLLVVGDVNPTLAGALAAAKLRIPVIHLEAGLRSRDMSMPDEINRLVTDQLSAMHLCPTEGAVVNLSEEGVSEKRIHFVGNSVAEAVLRNLDRAVGRRPWESHGASAEDYILVTIHRPENTQHPEKLAQVVKALAQAPLPVLMTGHSALRPLLERAGVGDETPNIRVIDPVKYLDMLALEHSAACIVTDSGGVQEEACMMLVPCVTVRRVTEIWATVDTGANRLVAADREAVLEGIDDGLSSTRTWPRPARWDELVSERIVRALGQGIVPLWES